MSKEINQLPATSLGRATDLYEKEDGVSGASQKITGAQVAVMTNGGAKRYRALISSDNLNDPIVTVLENTLGATVAWTRSFNGIYLGTISGGFDPDKTILFISNGLAPLVITYLYVESNQAKIVNLLADGSATVDDMLLNASVEINVYP
jgi:hypothetical protein